MPKKIKSRILIGNRHLGDLIYNTDKEGRGYLKFSFVDEIADFNISGTIETNLPVPMKLTSPIRVELTYKFEDEILMVKKIPKKDKPTYAVYSSPIPANTVLFYLRIKNWRSLAVSGTTKSSLILPEQESDDIAVIFSFAGQDGRPYSTPYEDVTMGEIRFPNAKVSRFYIGTTPDPDNTGQDGLRIYIPYLPRKDEVR